MFVVTPGKRPNHRSKDSGYSPFPPYIHSSFLGVASTVTPLNVDRSLAKAGLHSRIDIFFKKKIFSNRITTYAF